VAFDRRAGQHARERVRRYARRGLVTLALVTAATVAAGSAIGFTTPAFAVVEVVVIAAMVFADNVFWPVIERWDRGAAGEESVGDVLEPLERAGWRVLHDVVVASRGNIDHVVLGRGGLFTIETKSHGGRIRAARIERAMLSQAYAQAKLLERVTGERVTPLLVFSRAYLQPAVSRQRGVTVLPARMLAGHLERQPEALAPERALVLHQRLGAAASRA
jgi:Holliday junction resolvase-like predicted endonuclease